MLSCLIVEDDDIQKRRIKRFIESTGYLYVGHESTTTRNLIDKIEEKKVELIFLDINLSGNNEGIDFLKTFGSMPNLPPIIVVSAHTELAIEAYRHYISYFLPKPIKFEEFKKAVKKALENKKIKNEQELIPQPKFADDYIIVEEVKDDLKSKVRIKFDEIIYICSSDRKNYIEIATRFSDEKFIIRNTLKYFIENLSEKTFRKISNSHIVNFDFIRKVIHTPSTQNDKLEFLSGEKLKITGNNSSNLPEFFSEQKMTT